jgi:hypothetical protein
MAAFPTVADVRSWTGVTEFDLDDAQVQRVLDAESAIQAAYCWWDDADLEPSLFRTGAEMPAPLVQALLRRCARHIAARPVPLGSLPVASSGLGGEYGLPGAGLLPRFDPIIEQLEAPYREAGIA